MDNETIIINFVVYLYINRIDYEQRNRYTKIRRN